MTINPQALQDNFDLFPGLEQTLVDKFGSIPAFLEWADKQPQPLRGVKMSILDTGVFFYSQ